MLQYQIMEQKAINTMVSPESPTLESLFTAGYQTSSPHLNLHLNNLYYLISKLFQQQNRTNQELQMVRKELETMKGAANFQQNQNFQQESSQHIKKEDVGQPPIKQKKKLPKQFKCQLPFCTRKYGSVTALRAHMRTKHFTNDDNLDFVPL